jgi:DNA-binding PucR family transcriptional regulator
VALLLHGQPQLATELAHTHLAPLLELPERRREPMLETLAAWLQRPGQHTALAEQLHVHARTVRYRIDRLRQLLGPVVDDPDRRLELALAVRAAQSTTLLTD